MNVDSFLERWNVMGLQRQLITCLMAHMRAMQIQEIEIPLDLLDDISTGESLVMMVNGNRLLLRYSPEQTQLLTIQEGASWTPTRDLPPAEQGKRAAVLTDSELVKRERQQASMNSLREKARAVRNRPLENLGHEIPQPNPLT